MTQTALDLRQFPITREQINEIIDADDILDQETYEKLFDHYVSDMPYGTAKARSGDPYHWIMNRLRVEFPQ